MNAHELDRLAIDTIRFLAVDAVQHAKSGHPGMPLDAAPMAYVLWTRYLKHNPAHPGWIDRDRFVLSAGHASALLYALLHLTGYEEMTLEQLHRFRQWQSLTPGHPESHLTNCIEASTGPLGQGVGNAVGMAIAEAHLAARYNRPGLTLFDHHTYVLASDGDMMEGVQAEAASLAGHLRLGKLIVLYDSNRVTLSGTTSLAFTEDVAARYHSYGWHVQRVDDGNDLAAIARALQAAREVKDQPSLIVVRTIIGYGAPDKAGSFEAHGNPLGGDEVKKTKANLGWPTEPPFLIPPAALRHLRSALERGKSAEDGWNRRMAAYRQQFPALAAEIERRFAHELPPRWDARLPDFPADAKGMATRKASEAVLQELARTVPELIGGSGDLDPSTFTWLKQDGDFESPLRPRDGVQGTVGGGWGYDGRNVHFGVREHAMGAAVNGLAYHGGFIPFGATFLVFSDYMRPAVRLSAIARLHSIWVYTHDSIAVGEDGPTHEAVEQVLSLRAIPHMVVLRPGDANETREAWRVAIARHDGPTTLILTRQHVPTLDRTVYAPADGVRHGAYVLNPGETDPELILIGTGSEVPLIAAAERVLRERGVRVRLVSMPSWELFAAETPEYRDAVLPPAVTARLAVEAGRSIGWERWVGPHGDMLGVDRFGASAPGEVVMKEFGFTVDNVVARALAVLGRAGAARGGSRLRALGAFGQSVWLDYLRRHLFGSGELAALIRDDDLRGLTSNPSIFEKAIAGSTDYDEAIARLADRSAGEIYEQLAVEDLRTAADLLRPTYEATGRADGYVSLEVSPRLAHDTAATVAEARRLWARVERDNLMIKVPATPAGIPAIRQLLSEGINVNITLLFSREVYAQVADAHLAGLEDLVARGGDPRRVASVASFFVSRIDTAVDALLEEHGASADLIGKTAIANARLAYQDWKERLRAPRWQALARRGARPQRLLWASTSTKDPRFADVRYVEALIGPETIDTIPPATMTAFRDHGQARATLEAELDEARAVLAALPGRGISLSQVADRLLAEGVDAFRTSFDRLMAAVDAKCKAAVRPHVERMQWALPRPLDGEVRATLADWQADDKVRRLWARDPTLWTGADEGKWLDWLTVADHERGDEASLVRFAAEVQQRGFTHVALLGMGGSSLAPDVLARTFGPQRGYPELRILDSTDPAQIRTFEAGLDLRRTLFIVSSKSGTTLEPNLLDDYFHEKVVGLVGAEAAGRQFVVITDPGSPRLQQVARERGYWRTFFGVPGIGGRYSALSRFGLVPAAAMGIDVAAFLDRTEEMAHACASCVPARDNPGVLLGAVLGTLARGGRDKITLIASPKLIHLGAWIEQLLAESTGKQGRGLIPIDREPLGPPEVYGQDRQFVYLRFDPAPDPADEAAVAALERAGQPVVRLHLAALGDLGQAFFQWELATAVAGSILGINAFDQPDVEASKVEARRLTDAYERTGSLAAETPFYREGPLALFADAANQAALAQATGGEASLRAYLRAHLRRLQPGDYFAILAYVEHDDGNRRALDGMRRAVRDARRVATCVGFGPRFLHSTGQAYKGGPNSGVFLQLTCDAARDLAVPGKRYGFGVVEAAQARGDLEVLSQRDRRALRVHLGPDVGAGLQALARALTDALA